MLKSSRVSIDIKTNLEDRQADLLYSACIFYVEDTKVILIC